MYKCAPVKPLKKVFEGIWATFGKMNGRAEAFEEYVPRIQGGSKEGGGCAEKFAVDKEELFGGPDGDVDNGFEKGPLGLSVSGSRIWLVQDYLVGDKAFEALLVVETAGILDSVDLCREL